MIDNKNITLKFKKHHLNNYLENTLTYCIEQRKENLLEIIINKNKGNKVYNNISKFTTYTGEQKIDYIKEVTKMKHTICQKNSVVAIELIINIKMDLTQKEVLNIWDFLKNTFFESRRTALSFDLMKENYIKLIFIPLSESKDRWGNKVTRIGAKYYLDGRKSLSNLQKSFYEHLNKA